VNNSPKNLFSIATVAVLLSIGLTTTLRSIQAQAQAQGESQPAAQLSNQDSSSSREISGTLNDQGQLRKYQLYTPSSYNSNRPMPLVLVFHGHDGTGNSIAEVTRFNEVAEQKGFIVVYPDGINTNWSLRGSTSGKVDDVSFATALITHIQQIRNIDRHKIYVTGFSKGAILAQDLACEVPDRIAAFASVAGSLPVRLKPKCQPKTPVSMLMINGTNDSSVRYEGDDKSQRGALVSVPETVNFWRSHDECTAPAQAKQLPPSNPSSLFKVNVSQYSACRNNSEVTLMAVENGGHLWPGGASQDASVNRFNANLGFNASQTIWDFFQRHSLP
jgi:polyhydroxybutyrate depolymerase